MIHVTLDGLLSVLVTGIAWALGVLLVFKLITWIWKSCAALLKRVFSINSKEMAEKHARMDRASKGYFE